MFWSAKKVGCGIADAQRSPGQAGDRMPKCLESMPTKHIWTFRSRLRSRAFGWKGSHLACQRLKEAVTEIKKVARVDPVTAGDGVVSLMERIWPAFQDVDSGWTASGRRSRMTASITSGWFRTSGANCAVPVQSPLARQTSSSACSGPPGPIHGRKLRARNQRLPVQPGVGRPPSGTALSCSR
jgi:hypothetical protein